MRETDAAGTQKPPASGITRGRWLLQTLLYIVVAIGIALVIRTFLAQIFVIPSASMRPTLLEGDRLVVTKLFDEPSRGDIVVFDLPDEEPASSLPPPFDVIGQALGLVPPSTDLVKRVVGIEGDEIEIRAGMLLVNGDAADEAYLQFGTRLDDMVPVVVPDGHVFLLGDNRNQSRDSRAYGTVHRDQIIGRAVAIVWPISRWQGL